MTLLDANVLVYAVNAADPRHAISRAAVLAAAAGRFPAVLVPQVLLEFFAVITNPRRVPRPLDAERAWAEIVVLRAALPVLDPGAASMTALGTLIAEHRPIGASIFDVFLAAQMRSHGIATICTYNGADFEGIAGIRPVVPEDVVARLG